MLRIFSSEQSRTPLQGWRRLRADPIISIVTANTSAIFLPVALGPPGAGYKMEEGAFSESACQAQGRHPRQYTINSVRK